MERLPKMPLTLEVPTARGAIVQGANDNEGKGTRLPDFESAEFKDAIRELESFYGMDAQDKFLVLITALHLKPASLVITRNKTVATEQLFSKLKLHFKERKHRKDHPGFFDYAISASPENLEKVLELDPENPEHARFGAAVGYPETAIKAFNGEDDDTTLHPGYFVDLLTKEQRQFIFFAPSHTHHKEEMGWLQKFIDATRKHAPRLYSEILYRPK